MRPSPVPELDAILAGLGKVNWLELGLDMSSEDDDVYP